MKLNGSRTADTSPIVLSLLQSQGGNDKDLFSIFIGKEYTGQQSVPISPFQHHPAHRAA